MKKLIGTVVSDKMANTVVVETERFHVHPIYKKATRRSSRIKAHTEKPIALGSTVVIVPTKPMSKEKHFLVSEILTSPTK